MKKFTGYDVTLTGGWSRANTTGGDAAMVRRRLARDGMGSFVTRRDVEMEDGLPVRHGTFKVTMFYPTLTYARDRVVLSRAKTLLRWYLQDITCRSPKLHDIQGVVRRHYDETTE